MELNDKKFAVLVDADNISHRKIKDILDEIANYGTPTIKRIYGDFTNPKFAAWKEVLLENSITPIQQYAYTTGKNATDSALIIDAMDILHKEGVDGFCIVSSDSDYTRLASRIRESGREVLGFGEKKTPKPFIKSCDKFIYVEILGQTPPEKAAPAKKKADAKRSAGAEAPVGPAAETAGEKKPSPDAGHASTIIRPFDDEFRTLLENTIDDAADDSGWASLGDVGSVLSKKMPDFDPRNYGYKKLSLLVRALSDAVDMKTEQQRVYVRNRVGEGFPYFGRDQSGPRLPRAASYSATRRRRISPAGGRSSMSAAICPISSSPSSRSPSKIPRFGRPRPIRADNSSASAPRDSASSTVRQKPLRMRRVGITFLSVRIVPPSCTSTHRRLNASQAELSRDSAKRVPNWHPSAPRAKAASMPAPVAMPPAAMSGRSTACRTCGTRAIVVVSSRPL